MVLFDPVEERAGRRGGCQLLGVVWVMGTCTHTHAHTHIHIRAHACTRTHTHTCTHTHTHAHTHTYMHTTLMHIPADVTTEGWLQQCVLQAEISRETHHQDLHNSTIQTRRQGKPWAVYICLVAWLYLCAHVPVLPVACGSPRWKFNFILIVLPPSKHLIN